MRGNRDAGDLTGDLAGKPGGYVELGLACGVPGGVVVAALTWDDLDRGQGLRALAQIDDPDRHLGTGDQPLDERGVAVGEATQHSGGQLGRGADWAGPERGTAARGLDVQREPELGHDEVDDGGSAEVMERFPWQRQ